MYLPFAEVTSGPPLSPLHESTPPTPNTPAHCILPFVRLNRLFGQFSVPPLKKAWQAPRVYRFTCACCGVVAMLTVCALVEPHPTTAPRPLKNGAAVSVGQA